MSLEKGKWWQTEKVFEEIMAENHSIMSRDINIQNQEDKQIPNRLNPNPPQSTWYYNFWKLTKENHESSQINMTSYLQKNKNDNKFLTRNHRGQRVAKYFLNDQQKGMSPASYIQRKYPSWMKGKSRISNEEKLIFYHQQTYLKRMAKEISKQKGNDKRRNFGASRRNKGHSKQKYG